MRDSAVLNRPVTRESTWREPASRQPPIHPALVLLGGLFVLALAIGFGVTKIVPGGPVQRVSDAEYTAVVAQLFLKDRNVSLARDRLTAAGDPSDLVRRAISAGQAGQLALPIDRAALDSLSAALLAPSPAAAIDLAATDLPASTAPIAASTDGESRVSWIGPFVAFFFALALGFLVLARTAGLSFAALRFPWKVQTPRPRPASPRRASVVPNRPNETGRQSSVSIAEVDLLPEDRSDPASESTPTRATTVRRSRSAVAPASRPSVFQSHYRVGDDPFEEIHPISDPRTGGLIAACGLTATLHVDSIRSGGYYAFTAWIQDYSGGDELHAAGLVAPGATEVERGAIDSWVQSGQVDSILSLEPNATVVMGNDDIKATVTVVKVTFGEGDRIPDAFVTGLDIRFEVHQN